MAKKTIHEQIVDEMRGQEGELLAANAGMTARAERIMFDQLARNSLPSNLLEVQQLARHSIWVALVYQATVVDLLLDDCDLLTIGGKVDYAEFERQFQNTRRDPPWLRPATREEIEARETRYVESFVECGSGYWSPVDGHPV